MLISLIDGTSREILVSARVRAMKYGCAAGIALLSDDSTKTDVTRAALIIQRCELLYLDRQFDAAVKVYDSEIEPLLGKLPLECAALLADNRTTITHVALAPDPFRRFYHEVDVRRLLGVELHDASAALEADQEATAGQHHRALASIWKSLCDAYYKRNWRVMHWAHCRMARECLALDLPDDAAWHAVQGFDKDLVQTAGKKLAESRELKRITRAIDRFLTFSSLVGHASLVTEFFWVIADCIPDDRVDRVITWISPWLDLVPKNWSDMDLFQPIWKLIGRLAYRIHNDLALQISQKIATHSLLLLPSAARKQLVNTWTRLLQEMTPQHLDQFINSAILLTTTAKHDVDFVDSINLVCMLANKSESCRNTLRAAIFPAEANISNPILMQAASILGWRSPDVNKLNSDARWVAMMLRKQVEIIDPGTDPTNLGGQGVVSNLLGEKILVVHVSGAQDFIDGMTSHLESLNDNSIRELVESMLTMIANDLNIVGNRAAIIYSLEKFASRLPRDLAERSSEMLGRIARGDFKESIVGQTHQEAINPLNPFKMGLGDPRDLRGVALVVLASGSKRLSAWSEQLHSGILRDILEIDDEKLSRLGVNAALKADRLSEAEAAALLASSLDGSAKTRQDVLRGIATVDTVLLDRQGLRLAARATSRASHSVDLNERASAAMSAKFLLRRNDIDEDMRQGLISLLVNLATDISHFVRQCAT